MKSLILYSTKYGTTEECARMLANKLNGEVDTVCIKDIKNIDASGIDIIIIGSPVYAGQIMPEVRIFCRDYINVLREKKIALFICGMDEESKAYQSIERLFPREISDNAVAKSYFGGKFTFDKMNMMEKIVIQKMTGLKENVNKLFENKIDEFAYLLNECSN